jgi:hypothetical protein
LNNMRTKIIIAGLLLSLGAIALVAAGPVLAHPFWGTDSDEAYPPMMGWYSNYTTPSWGVNGTCPAPWWNDTLPYSNGDEYYCPGPYWGTPDGDGGAPANPESPPQRGYGCGGPRGWGGMMGYRRGPVGWTG